MPLSAFFSWAIGFCESRKALWGGRLKIFSAWLAIAWAPIACGQGSSPAFDVASVKLLPPPVSGSVSSSGGPGTTDPGRLTRSNVTLASILVQAFQTQGHLITGPDWLSSERYEIIAIVPRDATRADIPFDAPEAPRPAFRTNLPSRAKGDARVRLAGRQK